MLNDYRPKGWGFDPRQNSNSARIRQQQRDWDRIIVKFMTMPWYARLWWSIYGRLWVAYRALTSRIRKAGRL